MRPDPTHPIPIAVLASGQGGGFESIADSIQAGELNARIVALACDVPGAPVLAKAEARGIPVVLTPFPTSAPAKEGPTDLRERRLRHEEELLSKLLPLGPRFLVMAGFMRIVTPRLLEAFRSERGYARVVNIHPSLLPAFPGVKSYAQAYRFGAKMAGVTVHFVEEDVDSGPICAQEAFPIAECRSEEEVETLGRRVEHRLYPRTLGWVLPEKFELQSRDYGRLAGKKESHRRLCVCPI